MIVSMRSRPRLPALVASLFAYAFPTNAHACRTLVVTKAKVAYAHSRTIQAAVSEAKPCDWILVAPGVYRGSVVIRTPDLHLRGLDRNRVVLDGDHRPANGIDVRANDVWIENLTVRNFDRRSLNDEETGNEIRWRRVRGWFGNYLTVYDTGLLGGYGLWAFRAVRGEWHRVYASGFDDSGFYVRACRDCQATISHARAERNAYGFAGSNSGGRLVIENSLFRDNTIGLTLNSTLSDPPPPQLGTCDVAANRLATPTIASSAIERCTIIRHNRIVANNDGAAPANTSSFRPGAGIGVSLLGAYGDLLADNVVAANRNIGILAVEQPLLRPKRSWPIHFQLAGNRFEGNDIRGSRLDLVFEGGLFGLRRSLNNCFAANNYARSLPADLAPFECTHATTPNPSVRESRSVIRIVTKLNRRLPRDRARPQPAPMRQPTMPAPCRGAPPSPVC
jgi:hypothetical protein